VKTDQPLNVIRYPKPDVIEAALNLYQTVLKKPSVTVFALDFSGSMQGDGETQVKKAMNLLLSSAEASKYMLQMGDQDTVILLPFNNEVSGALVAKGPAEASKLAQQIDGLQADGGTDIYSPTIVGLQELAKYDPAAYSLSVVLMTDGESNQGKSLGDVQREYRALNRDIPVYSIMFGQANPDQLNALAAATRGSVFDGRTDLIGAFKKVRGYN
jgi:Ca-activated chloride channel family protein